MFNICYVNLVEDCGYLVANTIMEQEYSESVKSPLMLHNEEYYTFDSDYKYYEAEIYNDEELYRMAKRF